MTRPDGATEILPLPQHGRTFTTTRRVRMSDTDARGHLRLDALFRYLQDVATDDARDALPDEHLAWVLRRALVDIDSHPMLEETLELTTWCSGYGSRWAERRTSIVGENGGSIDTSVLWVAIDPRSGKPIKLPPNFKAAYDEASSSRAVTARLRHGAAPDEQATSTRWVFRASDTDRLGHVNNAAFWTIVEEELANQRRPASLTAEIEYRQPVPARSSVDVAARSVGDTWEAWLSTADATCASLRVTTRQ